MTEIEQKYVFFIWWSYEGYWVWYYFNHGERYDLDDISIKSEYQEIRMTNMIWWRWCSWGRRQKLRDLELDLNEGDDDDDDVGEGDDDDDAGEGEAKRSGAGSKWAASLEETPRLTLILSLTNQWNVKMPILVNICGIQSSKFKHFNSVFP